MGNAHNLKDEASEDGAKGNHSSRSTTTQGDEGRRLGQRINASPKRPVLHVGAALGEPGRLMQMAQDKEKERERRKIKIKKVTNGNMPCVSGVELK
jgi:hypothetical protein